MRKIVFYTLSLFMVLSCNMPLPGDCARNGEKPVIYPDYTDVAVPCNIAPLNYVIRNGADRYITCISSPSGEEVVCRGAEVLVNVDRWHSLLASASGKELEYRTFVERDGVWSELDTFKVRVAEETVDDYVTYRFLAPSYEFHSYLSIDQRNVTNFKSRELYHNRFEYTRTKQQCINCHSFQNYHTDKWQLHIRLVEPGTIIVNEGEGGKFNLKTEKTISGGFYPAWHPTENLIVYSNNLVRQFFFARNSNRIEQQDSDSDLIMYDVDRNVITSVSQDTAQFETYPAWSPDGMMLYYSTAVQPELKELGSEELGAEYDAFRYDIYRKPFDPSTRTFGGAEMVMDAKSLDKSALFPRISPDGRYMLIAVARFGSCHNYHRDSDLWLMDLETGATGPLDVVNSDESDSYHNWSSNGRWIIFTSRRMDGVHTRIFMSYFDENGVAHKPFVLPQKDPEYYLKVFKSFSVPEPTVEPLHESLRQVRRIIAQDSEDAVFKE